MQETGEAVRDVMSADHSPNAPNSWLGKRRGLKAQGGNSESAFPQGGRNPGAWAITTASQDLHC